jgi:hypothetical protein
VPNLVLATRPLAGEFADVDEVWLVSSKVIYVNAPASEAIGGIDSYSEGGPWSRRADVGTRMFSSGDATSAALRKAIEERFAYRFDEVAFADLLKSERSRGVAEPDSDSREGVPARVLVARSTFQRPTK